MNGYLVTEYLGGMEAVEPFSEPLPGLLGTVEILHISQGMKRLETHSPSSILDDTEGLSRGFSGHREITRAGWYAAGERVP